MSRSAGLISGNIMVTLTANQGSDFSHSVSPIKLRSFLGLLQFLIPLAQKSWKRYALGRRDPLSTHYFIAVLCH